MYNARNGEIRIELRISTLPPYVQPTSTSNSNILGVVTDGDATRWKCITFQQSILCPSAVKLIQKDGTCSITESSEQRYCSWKRRRESSIKNQLNSLYWQLNRKSVSFTFSVKTTKLMTSHLCIWVTKQSVTDTPPGIVDADFHSALSRALHFIITASDQPQFPITAVSIGGWNTCGALP